MPALMSTPPPSFTIYPTSTSGGTRVLNPSISSVRPVERMRLRPWLIRNIVEKTIPGLEWLDEKEQLVKIPWKHAARHGWTCDKDASLFRAWAIHTKKYDPVSNCPKANPKIWKANFRCAINSLPDILEVKDQGKSKGNDAYKIYKLIPKKARKSKPVGDGSTIHKKISRTTRRSPKTSLFKVQSRILQTRDSITSTHHPTSQQFSPDLWKEHNEVSQSQMNTDVWHSSVTFSNQSSPMRHELPPYSSPTSSRVSNLSSLPSPLSPTASVISPPPPYPCNRGTAYSPLYVRRGLMDYIADGRSQDDVTESNGYQDHHDTDSNCSNVPSDEEIVEIVDDMRKNSPEHSPTCTSPFDGNNNSSSYWTTSTLDHKRFMSDPPMMTQTSDLPMRPPPPEYYASSSHAFIKPETRASCQYMKSAVGSEMADNRITKTSTGACFYVM
ncbi:uncharacterized protein [Asterias amurensis]|uniref:uncharacterized protein n=1 Tax=Asterias amurensis TaxID=7602 RepID=UPI003AB1E704